MRKVLVFIAMALFCSGLLAQEKDLARVHKIDGIEVYIFCEPLREYKVVKNTSKFFSDYYSFNKKVSSKVDKLVKKAKKEAKKKNIDFDALVYYQNRDLSAIKFTDEPTPENKGIGRVQRVEGVPVYIMNAPLENFRIVSSKKAGLPFSAYNTDTDDFVEKYARRFLKQVKAGKIDAIQYSNGKTAIGIKFDKS